MSRTRAIIGFAAAGLMLLAALDAGDAGARGRDTTFQMRNWDSRFIQRYPGDQAFAGGTVRMQGPEKGPYIERCYWTANTNLVEGPIGLTQRCYRHTLENTPE
jgi:hypothetical protein